MSSTMEIRDLCTGRQNIRDIWESDFEKNHEIFANEVALSIASKVLEDLRNTLSNPYKKPISFEMRLINNISFDITKNSSAKEIIRLAQSSQKLPPFKEWLEKFSAEKKESDRPYIYEDNKGIDLKYFQELMAIVGRLAEKKLNEEFDRFKSNSKHKDLQFKVDWYRKEDQQFSSPSDCFRDNCLRIELWFNKEAVLLQKIGKNSVVIEQNRIKQQELRHIRTRNNILLSIAAVIFVFVIHQSGIITLLASRDMR